MRKSRVREVKCPPTLTQAERGRARIENWKILTLGLTSVLDAPVTSLSTKGHRDQEGTVEWHCSRGCHPEVRRDHTHTEPRHLHFPILTANSPTPD